MDALADAAAELTQNGEATAPMELEAAPVSAKKRGRPLGSTNKVGRASARKPLTPEEKHIEARKRRDRRASAKTNL